MVEPKTKSRVESKCPKCGHTFLPDLKEIQSRAGKSARKKGASFERTIAKKLAEWWPGNHEFKRTPMSGGSILKEGWDLAGDITTTAPDFPWSLELKNSPSLFTGIHNFFSDKAAIWKWLDQADNDCPEHRIPMLIFNRFDLPTYCATFNDERSYIFERLERCGTPFFVFQDKRYVLVAVWQLKDMLESDPQLWV